MARDRAVEDLTPREEEVLLAIGQRLTNPEIADRMFISIRTVESHVSALLRKLGVSSRSDLIDAAGERARHTIEIPHNSFVGREREMEDLDLLLESHRLVTITGPPGSGKTRLALEIASRGRISPIVVEMEQETLLLPALARVLGLTANRDADLGAICGLALGARGHLLVLDDCDRVEDSARSIPRLLTLASSLKVLLTSRTPLGLSDEAVFHLSPLSSDGEQSASVALFLDRARASAPNATVDEADLDRVIRICARLDGLPLAIELAATRLRVMGLDRLEAELYHRLALWSEPGRTGHHVTLETAFQWSWEMLDAQEQSVMGMLAAFPTDFSVDMAMDVIGGEADRHIMRLFDRSLLAVSVKPAVPRRYRMLESLRAFVAARVAPETMETARQSHADVVAIRLLDVSRRIRTDDRRSTVEEAKTWIDDGAVAISWAVGNDPALARRLAVALAIVLEHAGPTSSGIEAVAAVARSPEALDTASGSDLLAIGGVVLYADIELGRRIGALAMERAAERPDRIAAEALVAYGHAYGPDPGEALSHVEEAKRLAAQCDEVWTLGSALQAAGIAHTAVGEIELALSDFTESIDAYTRSGDSMHVNNCRYMMARVAADAGVHQIEAVQWAEQCAAHARRSGNEHEIAHAMLVRAALPGCEDSAGVIEGTLATFRRVGDLRCVARAYGQLADVGKTPIENLRQALSISTMANDLKGQARFGRRLIEELSRADRGREAALVVGALQSELGDTSEAMSTWLESTEWRLVVLEGKAAGLPSVLDEMGQRAELT